MDENTKHIVASNLTIAYCANRPAAPMTEGFRESGSLMARPSEPLSEERVFEIYHRFLAQL